MTTHRHAAAVNAGIGRVLKAPQTFEAAAAGQRGGRREQRQAEGDDPNGLRGRHPGCKRNGQRFGISSFKTARGSRHQDNMNIPNIRVQRRAIPQRQSGESEQECASQLGQ